MKTGTIQALDVSHCGLDDASLRDMIVAPLSEYPAMLQSLSVSGNPGRLPAHVVPVLLQRLPEIRVLNLGGSIQGDNYIEGSLLSFAVLACLETLQELDISGYKVSTAPETAGSGLLMGSLGRRCYVLELGTAPALPKLEAG